MLPPLVARRQLPAFGSALPLLAPHMGPLIDEAAVLVPLLDQLAPHVPALAPQLPTLVRHRKLLLPHLPALLPHIPQLLPHLDKLGAPTVLACPCLSFFFCGSPPVLSLRVFLPPQL
eukprot:SAG22_NODE_707_length_7758_cov_8.503199_3_plen_117_part_00